MKNKCAVSFILPVQLNSIDMVLLTGKTVLLTGKIVLLTGKIVLLTGKIVLFNR